MASPHRSVPFLAAFNDIESHLRQEIGAKRSDSFWWIVDRAVDQHLLSTKQAEMLKDYGNLRNAIAHGRYHNGQPIAEPNAAVVAHIEQLRRLLLDPPAAVSILPKQQVESVTPDTTIAKALNLIRREGYAQIPVCADGVFLRLLTTNTIARWLARTTESPVEEATPLHDLLHSVSVGRVLDEVAKVDGAQLADPNMSAQQVIDALTTPDKSGRTPHAVVITKDGSAQSPIIRLITASDLSVLLDVVEES